MDWAGLVQAIQTALTSPDLRAWKSSTALLPGLSGTASTPHRAATSARWAGLAMSRWAESRLERPRTSRPPMALGWPVSEKGLDPGRPIWLVARCRLMRAELLWVPKLYWLSPWQYSERVAGAVANSRAASSMSFLLSPQMEAAMAGEYSRTRRLSASK